MWGPFVHLSRANPLLLLPSHPQTAGRGARLMQTDLRGWRMAWLAAQVRACGQVGVPRRLLPCPAAPQRLSPPPELPPHRGRRDPDGHLTHRHLSGGAHLLHPACGEWQGPGSYSALFLRPPSSSIARSLLSLSSATGHRGVPTPRLFLGPVAN